ncbi:Peptidoglycan N-acetylglucosamine deacetylase [Paenibacillus pasadenensis]|uniref:Peptidoglycan N-acetylglucosamine deacetylase n=1 Tax=Paenibacillus pasadenensis TaxID=217090 RepID=A0A2N5NBN3_9BACL|nr:Peptidoglycan N-acetylglucosamine deacetylase [Paenibacillus pasadenensis]
MNPICLFLSKNVSKRSQAANDRSRKHLRKPAGAAVRRRAPQAAALAALTALALAAGGCGSADHVEAGGFQPSASASPGASSPSASPDAGATQPGAGAPTAIPATASPSPHPSASSGPKSPHPSPTASPHPSPSERPHTVTGDTYEKPPLQAQAGPLAEPNDGRAHTAKLEKGAKAVALTFDDGPDAATTVKILDILRKEKVKATFFVVGTQVKKYPEVMQRIVDEGHALGNHTTHHPDLSKTGKTKILQEIKDNDTLIQKAVGITPTMFRPPYGATSAELKAILSEGGRTEVLWNVDTRDWAGTSVKTMRANVAKHAKPGSIILMHSFGSKLHTAELLPLIIHDLKTAGYRFVTPDQLG